MKQRGGWKEFLNNDDNGEKKINTELRELPSREEIEVRNVEIKKWDQREREGWDLIWKRAYLKSICCCL